jgi:hypothetical protein
MRAEAEVQNLKNGKEGSDQHKQYFRTLQKIIILFISLSSNPCTQESLCFPKGPITSYGYPDPVHWHYFLC